METPAIECNRLSRDYREPKTRRVIHALSDLSMQVRRGQTRGLLGPNGAGKTTLIKILTTALLPSGGTARVFGHDVVRARREVRRLVGVMFGGERGLYPSLTGRENLTFWSMLQGLSGRDGQRRATELLDRVGLLERADSPVETYSKGMKQKLHLARALVGSPLLLILDEPTSGMDPVAVDSFRTLMRECKSDGVATLLATHDMSEAEAICDDVAFIDHGRLIALETPASLDLLSRSRKRVRFDAGDVVVANVRSLSCVLQLDISADGHGHLAHLADEVGIRTVLELLVASGATSMQTVKPTLHDVYMQLMGPTRATAQSPLPVA